MSSRDPTQDPVLMEALRQEGITPPVSREDIDPVLLRALEQEGIISPEESAEEAPGLVEGLLRVASPENLFNTLVAATPAPEIQALGRQLSEGDIEGFLRGEVDPESPEAQFMALRETMGRGIGGAIANALNNAVELGGEVLADFGLTEASATVFNFTLPAREEINQFVMEGAQQARRAGVPKQTTEDALMTGNLIGFTAPLSLSFKAVSRIPVLGISNSVRTPFGVFARDAAAGAIYGFAFETGDLKERGTKSVRDLALFGAYGAATVAPFWFFKTFRNARMLTKARQRRIERELDRLSESFDLETGTMRVENLDGVTGRTILEQMSDESYLVRSAQGQRLLRNNADIEGLVQAIKEGSEASATHVVVRNISDFESIGPRLKRQFPNLSVQRVRRGDQIDVVVGHRGLSGQQMKQFKNEGRFPGQRVMKDGTTYEYLGRSSRKDFIKVRRPDSGKVVEIKDEGVSDMPYGVPDELRAPGFEALTDEFVELVLDRSAQVARAHDDLRTEAEVIDALRKGELDAGDFLKRDVAAQDVALYAEDFGLSAGGGRGFSLRMLDEELDPQAIRQLQEAGFKPFAFEVLGPEGEALARGVGGLQDDVLRIGTFQGQEALGAGGTRDVMRLITDQFPQIKVVRAEGRGGEVVEKSIDRLIGESGVENVQRLDPSSPTALRDLAELFLKDRELLDVADADAFASYSAQSLRRRLWRDLPAEDKAVLQNLREEMLAIFEQEGVSFEARAGSLGFNVNRLDDGRVVLRDVNSGTPLVFQDQAAAREALEGMQRNFIDQGERLVPEFGGGFTTESTKGLDIPEGPIFEAADLDPTKAGDIIPRPIISTIDGALQKLEEATGVPFWSKIFEPLDSKANLAQQAMTRTWLPKLQDIWSGLSRKERIQTARFIRDIEGQELTSAQRRARAKDFNLSSKQVKAAEEQRKLMLLAAKEFGIPTQDFIVNYYSRVVPFVREHKVVAPRKIFPEGIPRSMQPWFKNQRTGEMGSIEMDPWVVQMKYFRAGEFERHMEGLWERAWRMVSERNPFGLNDLSRPQRAAIVEMLGGQSGVKALRQMMEETLANLRGFPNQNKDTVRRLSKRLMEKLGVTANERVLEEYASVALSTLYGSALALRPRFVTRNFVQNLWFMYTRVGGKFAGEALDRALTMQGYDEALQAAAVRSQEGGVFLGSRVFDEVFDSMPLKGKGVVGAPIAAALRGGLRVGRKVRNASRRGLINVSTSDDLNRVWAFHWQRMHTKHWLDRFRAGEVSEAKFLNEAFPGYSNAVKRTFAERLQRMGEKEALDFAGKRAADENHFIYNLWSAPPWMQSRFGKLAGMFGRWPLGALEVYRNMWRYGTMSQKARFAARTAALAGAVQVTGHELGIDLFSWIAPLSPLSYGGGPVLDFAFDAKEIVENAFRDPGRARGAAHRLAQDVGRLSLPGQQFLRDFAQSAQANGTMADKYLLMMLGRPADDFNFFSQVSLNPDIPLDSPFLGPGRREVFDEITAPGLRSGPEDEVLKRLRLGETSGPPPSFRAPTGPSSPESSGSP